MSSKRQKTQAAAAQPRSVTRLAVALLILVEFVPRIYYAFSGAVPAGHDGFQHFFLQEFFFSGFATSWETPAWLPYVSHGTVGSWLSSICGSAGLSLFSLFGNLWGGNAFIYLFWLSDGLDRCAFAIGMALYIHYFIRDESSAWAAALLAAFTISDINSPWWNFRLFFLLPLILLLLHLALDKRDARYAGVAGLLLVWQVYCGLTYFGIFQAFLIGVYLGCMLAFNHRPQIANILAILKKPVFLSASVLACLAFAALFYWMIQSGMEEVKNFVPGRSADSKVTVENFLTYAFVPKFPILIELFSGISPCSECTVYAGAAVTGLLFAGLWPAVRMDRRARALLLFSLLIMLFSIGSVVAVLAYHLWPGMKLFRHISLVIPFLKVPAFVFVGFGIRSLLCGLPKRIYG